MDNHYSEQTMRMAEKLQSEMHEFIDTMAMALGPNSKVQYQDLSTLFLLLKIVDLQNEVIKLNKHIIPFENQ